jgi:hypothetical protein
LAGSLLLAAYSCNWAYWDCTGSTVAGGRQRGRGERYLEPVGVRVGVGVGVGGAGEYRPWDRLLRFIHDCVLECGGSRTRIEVVGGILKEL